MKQKLIVALALLGLLITSSGTVYAQKTQPPTGLDDPRALLENSYWLQPSDSSYADTVKDKSMEIDIPMADTALSPAVAETSGPVELASPIVNGDFEQGQYIGWDESSTNGYDVVVPYTPGPEVPAHSGSWIAWLGDDDNETTSLSQSNIAISDLNVLQLWYWSGSGDDCGYDYGYVKINSNIVHTWDLCWDKNTYGWFPLEINLSAYQGQTVTLSIEVVTDVGYPSGLLIDDVNLFNSHDAETVGVFRPSNGILFLKNTNRSGFANIALNYGLAGDYPVVGDWDGNGTDTIGVYRNGRFLLRNSNTVGFAEINFLFGQAGDQPIAGDWDGNGIDTIGVFRPSTGLFLLRNANTTGFADMSFFLGNVGDVGIAGDWDGDGIDTTGVFRPSNGVIFLKNTNATGFADVALNYGLPGDKPVVGDWDDDGDTTIGVFRNGQFLLRNSNTNGFAEIVFNLGFPTDMPIAGNWDALP